MLFLVLNILYRLNINASKMHVFHRAVIIKIKIVCVCVCVYYQKVIASILSLEQFQCKNKKKTLIIIAVINCL